MEIICDEIEIEIETANWLKLAVSISETLMFPLRE